jgi:hypothetical protein
LRQVQPNRRDRNNILYHFLTALSCVKTKVCRPNSSHLKNNEVANVSTDVLNEAYEMVWKIYQSSGGSDDASKSAEMKNSLIETIRKKYKT